MCACVFVCVCVCVFVCVCLCVCVCVCVRLMHHSHTCIPSPHTHILYTVRRIPATILVTVTMFVMGVASALDLDVLVNQDSVWGYAMILCGCLLVFLVLRLNPFKFRRQFYNEVS